MSQTDFTKRLYEGASKYYDVGTLEEFSQKIKSDSTYRQRVYDSLSKYYSLDDFSTFTEKIVSKSIPAIVGKQIKEAAIGGAQFSQRAFPLQPGLQPVLGVAAGLSESFAEPQRALTAGISQLIKVLGGDADTFKKAIEQKKKPSDLIPENIRNLKIPVTPTNMMSVGEIADLTIDPILLPVGKAFKALRRGGEVVKAIEEAGKANELISTIRAQKPSQVSETIKQFVKDNSDETVLKTINDLQNIGKANSDLYAIQTADMIKQAGGLSAHPENAFVREVGKASPEQVGQAQFKSFPKEPRELIKLYGQENAERIERIRGGVQSHEETIYLAEQQKENVAKKLEEGFYSSQTALTAEEAHAIKLNMADDIENIVDTIINGETDKKIEQLYGVIAAKGRALEAEKIRIPLSKETVENIRTQIKNASPELKDRLGKVARYLGLTQKEIKPSLLDKFVEFATMIKLTGISTHVRASVGNGLMVVLRVPERFLAGSIDALKYGLRGGERSVYASEALAESVGMIKSLNNAANKAWTMLVHPTKYMDEATKAGEVTIRYGAIGGKAGEIIRSPGRLIGGIDVAAKELNKGAEIYALATRNALKEGYKGSELANRIQYYIENPTAEMQLMAKESAQERVFQEELKGMAATLNTFRRKHPIARLIVPFWNTPVNLLKQGLQRTPATFLLPSTRQILKSGSQAQKLALASKMITGSALMTGIYYYASQGKISGLGSKSKAKNNMLRLEGWQPLSIKIGDTWVSYQGFEPLTTWFRLGADAFEGRIDEKTYPELAQKTLFSMAKQFSENPFFTGINDVFEALYDPEVAAPKFFAGLVTGSTIPVVLQQWGTRVFDPVVRQPRTFKERVQSRIPFGGSKNVKPLRNIFGEEIRRDSPVWQALGFTISLPKGGKLEKELARLSKLDKGLVIGQPSKIINGRELTEDEYDRFLIAKGQMLKESFNKFINNPDYDKIPDEYKIKVYRQITSTVNAFVRARDFNKYYLESEE